MAQWAKELVGKPGDLSLVPETPVGKENRLLQVTSGVHTCATEFISSPYINVTTTTTCSD